MVWHLNVLQIHMPSNTISFYFVLFCWIFAALFTIEPVYQLQFMRLFMYVELGM